MGYLDIIWDVIKLIPKVYGTIVEYWSFKRPASKVLGRIINQKIEVKIFVKDFIVNDNVGSSPKLSSVEGPTTQLHPNIEKVWAEAEARGIAELLNLLGSLGKRSNLEIVEMSSGYDMWNKDMIVLGAQAMKCMDFYEVMENVAYSVDEKNIYDKETGKTIQRENGYGYGIILKVKNPQMEDGVGFLLGGYGVLGTQAAIYYFTNNIAELGKLFDDKYFGVLVRAKVSAGKQSVKRLTKCDKVFS